MKKILVLGAMLAFAAMPQIAEACSEINKIYDISQEQRQSMIVECEKLKLQKVSNKSDTTVASKVNVDEFLNEESLNKMASIAKTAGATVREVAKELNVATNEFIKTPVGLLTAGLAIWYVAGDNIAGLVDHIWGTFGGIIIIILSLTLGNPLRKSLFLKETEQKTVKTFYGSEKIVEVKTYYTWAEVDDNIGGLAAIISGAQAVAIVVGLTWMF